MRTGNSSSRGNSKIRFGALLTAAVAGLGFLSAPAQAATWLGGGGANTNWSNALNWDFLANPDSLFFNDAANPVLNNDISGQTINNIQFAFGSTTSYFLNGNPISTAAGSIVAIINLGSGTQTLSMPIN